MGSFQFKGEIPGSKSVFNRALIVQSYFPSFELQGFADCDDVRFMREGLKGLQSSSRIDCGEGGTTFRFMALRASRIPGVHRLKATARLLQRPQSGLLDLLHQLGVKTEIQGQELVITSTGWNLQKPLQVNISESSQYASALVLNAWLLPSDLRFELTGHKVSESYFQLTLQMLEEMGMKVQRQGSGYLIPAGQKIAVSKYRVESDLSSGFTMAAAGAVAGSSVLENFPFQSAQPDKVFIEILKAMGAEVENSDQALVVKKGTLKGISWDLGQSPDLFPVLAVVCSWARGESTLFGAPHLVAKESNRIQKIADLFDLLGISYEAKSDGMVIQGHPEQALVSSGVFNPDQDHRMVMAATLMKLMGHKFKIEHPEAINKSFPEFWGMIGMKP